MCMCVCKFMKLVCKRRWLQIQETEIKKNQTKTKSWQEKKSSNEQNTHRTATRLDVAGAAASVAAGLRCFCRCWRSLTVHVDESRSRDVTQIFVFIAFCPQTNKYSSIRHTHTCMQAHAVLFLETNAKPKWKRSWHDNEDGRAQEREQERERPCSYIWFASKNEWIKYKTVHLPLLAVVALILGYRKWLAI